MKNIFDYATSELSQDAFLCWLIANSSIDFNTEDEQLRNYGTYFLSQIIGIKYSSTDKVTFNDSKDQGGIAQQWHDCDVAVWLKYNNDFYGIIIEDKTFSYIHDSKEECQLKKYKDFMINDMTKIHNSKENQPILDHIKGAVYKTSFVLNDEREEIKKYSFEIFDIYRIISIFKEMASLFGNPKNDFLKDYYKKIIISEEVMSEKCTTDIFRVHPDDSSFNIFWQYIFNNILLPKALGMGIDSDHGFYRGTYYFFTFYTQKHRKDSIAIEIQPRQLFWNTGKKNNKKDHNLICYFELYNIDKEALKASWPLQQWVTLIEKNKGDFSFIPRESTIKYYENGEVKSKKSKNLLCKLVFHFDNEKVTVDELTSKIMKAVNILKLLPLANS